MYNTLDEFFKAFYAVHNKQLCTVDSIVGENINFYKDNGIDLPHDCVTFEPLQFLNLQKILDKREDVLWELVNNKYYRGEWLGYITFESPLSINNESLNDDHTVLLINNWVFDFIYDINCEHLRKYLKSLYKENTILKVKAWSRFTDKDGYGRMLYRFQSGTGATEDELKEM